ncbi:MAG: Serine/threonine kinase [Myxococcaceae bacterium]|nr:Serine/threonine kinase [Myxococcaceae bacterium]
MPRGCPPDEQLDAYSRGLLSPADREEVERHARSCDRCGPRLHVEARRITLEQQFDSLPTARMTPGMSVRPPPRAPAADDPTADTAVSGMKPEGTPDPGGYERGSTLSRYVVLQRLAKGGMGEVYAAYDPDLDRKVAIKLLRSDFRGSGASTELRLRLLREAQAMARLAHPNVVTVHDVGLIGDQVFVAMEFVEGETLAQWLKSRPRTWAQILDVFLYAGRGLSAAHAGGLTHRDFKPDNVLIGKDKRVRVMDFGLAQAQAPRTDTPADPITDPGSGVMKRRITPPGTILGTPRYMAPEQLYGKQTDPRSDQFSFCVALYEALYGERPYAGDTAGAICAEIAQGKIRPPPGDSLVPLRIRRLILRGLREDPSERYRTMEALLIGLSRRKSAVVRQWTAIGAGAVVLITTAAAIQTTRVSMDRCSSVSQRLEGVWDGPVKAQARAAFRATGKPWAERAWTDAARAIDTYTTRWVELRREACEAREDAPDEALGRRIVCLGRRLNDVQAVSQLFTRADAEIVERAMGTALGLPSLSGCAAEPATPAAVVAPEAEALRAQLAGVKARLDAGKYAEGLKLAKEVLAKASASTDRGARAEAGLLAGILTFRQGDARTADALLEQAALDAEAAREDETAARAFIERVGIGALTNRYDDADVAGRFARAAVDRIGRNDDLEAALANNLGVLAWSRGRYDEAVTGYMRAMALRQQAFGSAHPLVARAWTNVGSALKAAGKYDEAISAYRKAQEIEEATLDPSHPAIAETLNNLGNALNEKGDRPAALATFRKSLEIKERAFGPDALTVGVTLTNLGAVLLEAQQLDEARVALERALAIKEKASGNQSITVAVTLTNLAAVERAANKPDRAIDLDRRALLIRERLLGPTHRDLAFNLTGLGDALLQLQRPDAAVASLERALGLRESSSGEPTLLASTRLSLAHALAASKKPPDRARALELVRATLLAWPADRPEQRQAAALEAALLKRR